MTPAPRNRQRRVDFGLYLFVIPALAAVLVFSYTPGLSAVYHSFFRWSGSSETQFIGIDNFRRLLADSILWQSFLTLAILAVANILKLIPSIFLAVLIHRVKNEGLQYFYRVLVVLPMMVPSLVVLFVWKGFFDPNAGALNAFLNSSGLMDVLCHIDKLLGWGVFKFGHAPAWLGQPGLIVPSLILWGFPWIGAVGVLMYLAGLQSIGNEVYEAADIDGVSSWQKFRFIELPLILTQVRITLTLLIIGTIQGFGLPLLLLGENGGAGGRGMIPGLWMYNRAFFAGEFGYACAIGLLIFSVILALTAINNRFVRVKK